MKFIIKNKIIIVIIFLSFMFLCNIIVAHPGRTDSNGGHYDRSTGEYHYHHGYPAHQHINGTCPFYTTIDTTDTSENFNETNTNNENISLLRKNECIVLTIFTYIMCSLLGILFYLLYLKCNELIKGIIFGIICILFLPLITVSFEIPSIIYNCYMNNQLTELIIPSIAIILIVHSICCFFNIYYFSKIQYIYCPHCNTKNKTKRDYCYMCGKELIKNTIDNNSITKNK